MEIVKSVRIACDAVAAAAAGLPVYEFVEVRLSEGVMSALSPRQRDTLARHLNEEPMHMEWPLSQWEWRGARWDTPLPAVTIQPIPTTGSRDTELSDALARSLDLRAEQMVCALKANQARLAKARTEIDAALRAEVPTETWYLQLQADGTVSRYPSAGVDRVQVELYRLGALDTQYSEPWFTDEQRALQTKRRTELDAENNARIEALLPALKRAALARAQVLADEQAVYDALYARLPESLRERHREGFATEGEIHRALRAQSRLERGYVPGEESSVLFDNGLVCKFSTPYWDEVDSLTDAQYTQLKRLRAHMRDDESVAVRACYSYREATELDAPETIDKDNEVRVEHGIRAHVSWDVPKLGTVVVEVLL